MGAKLVMPKVVDTYAVTLTHGSTQVELHAREQTAYDIISCCWQDLAVIMRCLSYSTGRGKHLLK